MEDELDEELRYHLARQIEADIASGMTPDEARRGMAGVEQRKEECRDARGLNLIDNLGQDLRFAARQLLKSPGFTAIAVLMIALGMAASVAIVGFVDAALVKPLPYREPARLVNVTESTKQIPRANLSYLDYLDWKRLNTVLSSLDVHNGRGYMLRTATGTELVAGARVSDGFFRTLGIAPGARPRFPLPAKTCLGHRRASSSAMPPGRSASAPASTSLVSRSPSAPFLTPSSGSCPRTFNSLRAARWSSGRRCGQPAAAIRGGAATTWAASARLKDGVAIETARAEMESIAKQLEAQYPDSNRDQGASVDRSCPK